jgi:hypothetical protein
MRIYKGDKGQHTLNLGTMWMWDFNFNPGEELPLPRDLRMGGPQFWFWM